MVGSVFLLCHQIIGVNVVRLNVAELCLSKCLLLGLSLILRLLFTVLTTPLFPRLLPSFSSFSIRGYSHSIIFFNKVIMIVISFTVCVYFF